MLDWGQVLDAIGIALTHLLTTRGVLLLVLGVILGTVMGVIPGLGASATMVLVLPFTYGWEPLYAFIVFSAIMGAVTVAGSVTAILLNVPGTDSNIATTLDGYPLAQQGRGMEALVTSAISSFAGSLFGLVLFVLLVPFMFFVALAFGPPEVCWLGVFTLVVLAIVTGGSTILNLLVGSFAFVLSTHGLGPLTGIPRFSHGISYLWGGIPLLPALVGTFAISSMIIDVLGKSKTGGSEEVSVGGSRRKGIENLLKNIPLFFRAAILGFIIGVIPGVGGTVANYLAYGQAVQTSKNRENFGKGDVRGIVAPEAANNAKDVGQLVPTFALGVPGSGMTAVFLGVLMLHGLTPGPFLMREHFDVVALIMLALSAGFCLSCLVVFFGGVYLAKALRFMDMTLLCVFVVTVCFIATYFVRYQIFDSLTALLFGLLGYVVTKLKGSRILLVLPLVIGPIIETNFVISLQISLGDYTYFFSPLSIAIIIVTLVSIVLPFIRAKD